VSKKKRGTTHLSRKFVKFANVQKVTRHITTEWEPRSSRPEGRPRLRRLDQVEEDLKMKVRNWRERRVKIEDCGTKS
jgi:hypothetical protein